MGAPGSRNEGGPLEQTGVLQTRRMCRESTRDGQPEKQADRRTTGSAFAHQTVIFATAGTGLALPQDSLTSFKGLRFASLKGCLWGLWPKIPNSTDGGPTVLQRSQRARLGGRSKALSSSASAWEIGSYERGGKRVSALPRTVLLFLPPSL